MTWFEDMKIGAVATIGSVSFEQDSMVDFATRYDPRPYFMDEEAAVQGPYGLLVASPWQVNAEWMGLMIRNRDKDIFANLSKPSTDGHLAKIGPSPGFLDLSWAHPVVAGDTITYSVEVAEHLELRSRPQWGICRNLNLGINQDGLEVMRFFGQVLMERRPKK